MMHMMKIIRQAMSLNMELRSIEHIVNAAIFTALLKSLFSMSSPTNAPKKGPIISPHGA